MTASSFFAYVHMNWFHSNDMEFSLGGVELRLELRLCKTCSFINKAVAIYSFEVYWLREKWGLTNIPRHFSNNLLSSYISAFLQWALNPFDYMQDFIFIFLNFHVGGYGQYSNLSKV